MAGRTILDEFRALDLEIKGLETQLAERRARILQILEDPGMLELYQTLEPYWREPLAENKETDTSTAKRVRDEFAETRKRKRQEKGTIFLEEKQERAREDGKKRRLEEEKKRWEEEERRKKGLQKIRRSEVVSSGTEPSKDRIDAAGNQ